MAADAAIRLMDDGRVISNDSHVAVPQTGSAYYLLVTPSRKVARDGKRPCQGFGRTLVGEAGLVEQKASPASRCLKF